MSHNYVPLDSIAHVSFNILWLFFSHVPAGLDELPSSTRCNNRQQCGKTMPLTIPQITIHGWYKPFPVMGGLWHCFTHITSICSTCLRDSPVAATSEEGTRAFATSRRWISRFLILFSTCSSHDQGRTNPLYSAEHPCHTCQSYCRYCKYM